MSQKLITLGLLLGALSFVSCSVDVPSSDVSVTVPKTSEATDTQEQAPANQTPPTFADMININTPLATVEGKYKALPFEMESNQSLATELDAFAMQTETYSLIVWHKGKIVYESYPAPYSAETRSESASMHKSVMALLIGAAIEDGFISGVDAVIGAYIPEWTNDPRGEITVQDLLEMSSGLKPLSSEGGMNSPSVKFMMDGAGARETILGLELLEGSGNVFHYQNAVSQLLGLIIENATGRAYQDYLSDRLWKPLRARDAKVWLNEPDGFARTYSALYAVPRDWLRLGLTVKDFGAFNGSQIISKSYIQQMTSPSRAYANYGWQIWRGENFEPARFYNAAKQGFPVGSSAPFAVEDILYFDGFGGQRVYISRSEDLVIVRLGNVRMDWDDSKLPNLVLSKL